jgi:hypothetical protein
VLRVPCRTAAGRPQQARRVLGLGLSHLGEGEREERGVVPSPDPVDAGRTSALLLANSRARVGFGASPAFVLARVWGEVCA